MIHIDYGNIDESLNNMLIVWNSTQATSREEAADLLFALSPDLFDVIDAQGQDITQEVRALIKQRQGLSAAS